MSVVSTVCPVQLEPMSYIPLAKKAAYTIQLTIAAKNGQDVYMNEYEKICNLPFARELNHEITIKEILDTTGDACTLAPCMSGDCNRKKNCDAMQVWTTLGSLINNYLSDVTLKDLIDKAY